MSDFALPVNPSLTDESNQQMDESDREEELRNEWVISPDDNPTGSSSVDHTRWRATTHVRMRRFQVENTIARSPMN